MSCRVENPLAQWKHSIIGECQVEVLESAGQEMRWLLVASEAWYLVHIIESGETSTLSSAMSMNGLHQLPGIVTVFLVMCLSEQDKVTFRQLSSVPRE